VAAVSVAEVAVALVAVPAAALAQLLTLAAAVWVALI
jgi:hypothetical protein